MKNVNYLLVVVILFSNLIIKIISGHYLILKSLHLNHKIYQINLVNIN